LVGQIPELANIDLTECQVRAVSSQPFWLHWSDGGRMRRHAPDFFARLAGGRGVVIDVRAG
jgi:hypothetical protein